MGSHRSSSSSSSSSAPYTDNVVDGSHAVGKDLSECLGRINLEKSLGLSAQMRQ